MLRMAVRTADSGKPAAGVAAVEIALDDVLDDGPEEAVLLLETPLVLRQEPVEVMEEHPVENGAFRMARAVDSRHIGNDVSRNAPGAGQGKNLGTAERNSKKNAPKSAKRETFVDARSKKKPLERNAGSRPRGTPSGGCFPPPSINSLVESLAQFSHKYRLIKERALAARVSKIWGPALIINRLWGKGSMRFCAV